MQQATVAFDEALRLAGATERAKQLGKIVDSLIIRSFDKSEEVAYTIPEELLQSTARTWPLGSLKRVTPTKRMRSPMVSAPWRQRSQDDTANPRDGQHPRYP
jgi:hypothetical protein